MAQEPPSSPFVTREFTGEYKSAKAALAAARKLREENPDVDIQVKRKNEWTFVVSMEVVE